MPHLHDRATRESLRARLQSLNPSAQRKWGKMSVDQMLWHVGTALETALGTVPTVPERAPLPAPILRFVVLNLPWPKSAPTMRELVARDTYDFDAQRARCVTLMDDVASRPLSGPWPTHPILKTLTGMQVSRLQAKHIDHHLKQFGT